MAGENDTEQVGKSELRLHRLHAHPSAKGWRVDFHGLPAGMTVTLRIEHAGADVSDLKALASRLAFVWNMAEGIPLGALQAGCVRRFYDAVAELLPSLPPDLELRARAAKVDAAWEDHCFDWTDGRRADCPCAESLSQK